MKEILTSRLIDRPIRPLFPAHYLNEVQVMANVLSSDKEYDADILSIIGASASLHLSQIPFQKVTGAVRIGLVEGELVLMPTHTQLEESELDLVLAGTRDAVTMIEGFAREMPEERMLQAIMFGHKHIVTVINLIEELRTKAGLPPKPAHPAAEPNPLIDIVMQKFAAEFKQRKQTG